MNEQRLVTVILIVLLVLGAAAIAAVYFTTDYRMNILPGPASQERTETDPADKFVKKPLSPSDTVSRGAVIVPGDQSEKKVVSEPKSQDISSGQSPAKQPEAKQPEAKQPEAKLPEAKLPEAKLPETGLKEKAPAQEALSTQVPGSVDAVVLKDQPGKKSEPGPTKSRDITIHETLKSNGSFNTAQEVTEGIIVGKRGAKGDLSDFYKVRATGKSMILRLEPVLKKQNQSFSMTVFNANKKPVGQVSRKPDPAITLAVTPESTYYIKLDVRYAPVENMPQYRLYLKCK